MIEAVNHFSLYDFIQFREVDHHAGFPVNRAADKHFDRVVMPVPKPVVAFAVGGAVLLAVESIGVQTMAGAEQVAPSEIGLGAAHTSPMYSAKISGVS